ncbi:hypothetical protein HYX19_04140 [Candidatus Woesearchaeota archaeon]|nr:hypothetical protein [Candidatus Woesearchaeota archaeon]
MSKKKHSLKISYDGNKEEITLKTLNPTRFTHYGFGTFLEHIDPKEILISEGALEALLHCPERRGLQGLEFWPENRLAWGSLSKNFIVPYDSINCPKGTKSWLKKCEVY